MVVIGATNRPNLLDPALLRPGRFDEPLYVPVPDEAGWLHILGIQTRSTLLAGNANLEKVAHCNKRYTGADRGDVVRRAGLLALRQDLQTQRVRAEHFDQALRETRASVTLEMEREYEELRGHLEEQGPDRLPADQVCHPSQFIVARSTARIVRAAGLFGARNAARSDNAAGQEPDLLCPQARAGLQCSPGRAIRSVGDMLNRSPLANLVSGEAALMDWTGQSRPDEVAYPTALAFVLVHLVCFAAIWTGITWGALALCVGLYWMRIFAIGAGYHRYFSHRAYRTGRLFQFLLAFASQTSAQRGVLWWAAKHRLHHKHSDTEQDPHSPVRRSFLHAHFGWVFVPNNDATDYAAVRDLTRFPELMWLDRHTYTPAILLGFACWLLGGWTGLVIGFCWSTTAVWHATFSINSVAHLAGRKRYVTGDQSRNNWLLALLTMGEGWHNNHHAYQASVRQGFRWWEYDPTYYLLRLLSWCGLVWDLHQPPRSVVAGEQRLGRVVIDKAAAQLAASFPVNRIAEQVVDSYARLPGWSELKPRLLSARLQAETFWNEYNPPQMPSLEEVRRYARDRLAKTPSLDEIAERARERLLELVWLRVVEAAAAR